MVFADDLLKQAYHLTNKGEQKPDSSLRAAVSTAYYALFHLLIDETENPSASGCFVGIDLASLDNLRTNDLDFTNRPGGIPYSAAGVRRRPMTWAFSAKDPPRELERCRVPDSTFPRQHHGCPVIRRVHALLVVSAIPAVGTKQKTGPANGGMDRHRSDRRQLAGWDAAIP